MLGVLITNLGTPDAPTASALRRYLAEFLWDPRVVDLPRPLWWLILHGVILRVRPARSARLYREVWTEDGAPLLAISLRQRDELQAALDGEGLGAVKVALGMRYGRPSICEAMDELRDAGVDRLVVLPLYPQYSSSTTASTLDAVARALQRGRWVPRLRFITDYHDHPAYLDALADSVREMWEVRGAADKLLFSFHGTPERFREEGDPYDRQCRDTAQAVARRLRLEPDRWDLAFQSRFGREPWLKPYTDEMLAALAKEGVRRVDVICPGFSADCLETLEEVAGQNRKLFLEAGGEDFQYIPALNDRCDHIDALAAIVGRELDGWVT